MEHHSFELEDVFLPLYHLILITELLGKGSAASDVFWRHEVDCDLDAVGEITNLSRHSGPKIAMRTLYAPDERTQLE